MCAYNFTTFLVKYIFEEPRNRFPFLHEHWSQNDENKGYSILDIHLALIYRRKEDTAYLQYFVSGYKSVGFRVVQVHSNVVLNAMQTFFSDLQLKTLPIDAILAAAEKCKNRSKSSDWISALWSSEVNQKAGRSLVDFAMCAAARKKMPIQDIKNIVTTWLSLLNCDPKDSTLDIEVEKFVSLDEHSALSYVIGHKLAQKVYSHSHTVEAAAQLLSAFTNCHTIHTHCDDGHYDIFFVCFSTTKPSGSCAWNKLCKVFAWTSISCKWLVTKTKKIRWSKSWRKVSHTASKPLQK